MTDRKNIPVDERLFKRLAALKGEDDTWDDVIARAADALEADENGETDSDEACIQSARIPTEQVEEIARLAGDQAARELENRLTRP